MTITTVQPIVDNTMFSVVDRLNSLIDINNSGSGGGGSGASIVVNQLVNLTLEDTNSGTTFVNAGATDPVNLTLPPAETVGDEFACYVAAAQTFGFTAVGTDVITNVTDTSVPAGVLNSNVVGNYTKLKVLDIGTWSVIAIAGDWNLT